MSKTPTKSKTGSKEKAAGSALPEEGKKAPAFSLPADDGSTVTLKSLAGKKAVLYFYPKDDTPGCTTEGIAFSALKKKFDAAGTVVLGVSKDSIEKHCKFRDKHSLGVVLVSDEESGLCEAYGVWAEKNMYGKTYMGIERTTFLIRPDGKIAQIWRKVKVPGHVEAVLEAARSLDAA